VAEHLVVNVEAQLVRNIYDEAVGIDGEAAKMREQIAAVQAEANTALDPIDRARLQRDAAALLAELERLEASAAKTHQAANVAAKSALSLPDDINPADVAPVTRVTVQETKAELDEQAKVRAELAWERLREQRDPLLAASDWTQLPDIPEDIRKTWAAYRQKLRDLPTKTKDPAKVNWPDPPT
jgi:tail assembly chaperone